MSYSARDDTASRDCFADLGVVCEELTRRNDVETKDPYWFAWSGSSMVVGLW